MYLRRWEHLYNEPANGGNLSSLLTLANGESGSGNFISLILDRVLVVSGYLCSIRKWRREVTACFKRMVANGDCPREKHNDNNHNNQPTML